MSDLRVTREDGVLRLVITREDRRNALSSEVLDGMTEAVRHLEEGDRVVLVASAGDTVFCAGADLAVMESESTGLEQHEARGGLRRLVVALRECPLPVVARVQGLCLAGGVGLVLGCDVAVASDAAAFGLPEVNLGIWPFMVSALLARHVSPKIAMDLMLSGERISASRALDVGLLSRVVPAADLDAQVGALLAALAAKPPVAVRLGKAAYVAAQESTLLPALEAMQAQLSLLTQTADAQEGVSAFFAKRAPHYTGR
jgi:enoyl-CoA hydratase/carnithine racemase